MKPPRRERAPQERDGVLPQGGPGGPAAPRPGRRGGEPRPPVNARETRVLADHEAPVRRHRPQSRLFGRELEPAEGRREALHLLSHDPAQPRVRTVVQAETAPLDVEELLVARAQDERAARTRWSEIKFLLEVPDEGPRGPGALKSTARVEMPAIGPERDARRTGHAGDPAGPGAGRVDDAARPKDTPAREDEETPFRFEDTLRGDPKMDEDPARPEPARPTFSKTPGAAARAAAAKKR